MIVDKDIQPEKKLYYLGALVIEILNQSSDKKMEFFSLFQRLKEKENISVSLFILILDWLYIINVIKKNRNIIERCF